MRTYKDEITNLHTKLAYGESQTIILVVVIIPNVPLSHGFK